MYGWTDSFFPFSPDRIRFWRHSFLSLQIESGFVLQRRESYSLRSGIFPQSPQDQPGDWRSLVDLVIVDVKMDMLGLVVINVEKNIANESAVCSAIGHFGQEVSEIELGWDMGDQQFAHGNRFTDCVVAN
jgi:hypothetical protein